VGGTTGTSGVDAWWLDVRVQRRDLTAAVARTAQVRWRPVGGTDAFAPAVDPGPVLAAWAEADVLFRRAAAICSPGTAGPARDALRTAYWRVGHRHVQRLERKFDRTPSKQVEGRDEDLLIKTARRLVVLGLRAGSPAAAFARFCLLGGHPAAGPGQGTGDPEHAADGQSTAVRLVLGQGSAQADVLGLVPACGTAGSDGAAALGGRPGLPACPEAAEAEVGSVVEAKNICGSPENARHIEDGSEPLPGWSHAAAIASRCEQDPATGRRHVWSRTAHALGAFSRRPVGQVCQDVRIVALDDYVALVPQAVEGSFWMSSPSLLAYAVHVLCDGNERDRLAAAGLAEAAHEVAFELLRLSCAAPLTKRLLLFDASGRRYSACAHAASATLARRLCDDVGRDGSTVTEAVWRDEGGTVALVLRRADNDAVAVRRAAAWDVPDPSAERPVGPDDADALAVLAGELREVGLRTV
jgi:hypothetical protein